MRKNKVLVIDDDREFLAEFKESLDLNGFDVVTLSDPEFFADAATKHKPDVILLDLKMPKKNGFQVAEELRHFSELSKIPVIAMTGFFTESEYSLLMNICGIKDCVRKPVDPSAIVAKIKEVLESA